MTDDLYTSNIAQYEKMFKMHNFQVMKNGAGIKIVAIHMNTAIELVHRLLWDEQKHRYFVIIP